MRSQLPAPQCREAWLCEKQLFPEWPKAQAIHGIIPREGGRRCLRSSVNSWGILIPKMLTVICYIVAVSYLAFFVTYAFRSTARAKREAVFAGDAQPAQKCS